VLTGFESSSKGKTDKVRLYHCRKLAKQDSVDNESCTVCWKEMDSISQQTIKYPQGKEGRRSFLNQPKVGKEARPTSSSKITLSKMI
jgi:hypothetical protein